MTLKEKVVKIQPNVVDCRLIGGVIGCPNDYDFLEVKEKCPCNEDGTEMDCRDCWNREYIENK